jgi:hypothetical protein
MSGRAGLAAALAAAVTLLLAGGAGAQRAPSSFDGSCELDGVLRFGTAIGNSPTQSTWAVDAAGPCSGTLNGRSVADDPVTTHFVGTGNLSCTASYAPPGGPGTITFSQGTRARSDDVTIGFTFGTFLQAGIKSAPWTESGNVSGQTVGQSSFPLSQDLLDSCNAGTLRSVPVHLSSRTLGPFVG